MTDDRQSGGIEGTHGPMALLWIAVITPLLMIATAVALVLTTDLDWGALVIAGTFGTPMVLRWWNRTVVSPDGVRLRRWLKWRTLPWEDIAAVAEPSRWKRDDVVAVITAEGEPVALDLPGSRRAQFTDYALAHGMRRKAPGR